MSISGRPVVTLLGDSITAGFGLPSSAALPVRLAATMESRGRPVSMVNAGVSGDTMRDGLRRLDRDVPASTDLCIVALGANDLLRARLPASIRSELDEILRRLLARPTRVLLCGMRAPPWLRSYAPAFDALFPAAARAMQVPLYPFLLEGVALDPALNLPDRIHPNAAGIEGIARRLAPWVEKAL